MMNNARLIVGVQGLAVAERDFQHAVGYAKQRQQGRAPGAPAGASSLCALFGSAVPLSSSTLTSLYQTKSNYLAAYTASLDKAIKGGYILIADRATLLAQAQQVQIPS